MRFVALMAASILFSGCNLDLDKKSSNSDATTPATTPADNSSVAAKTTSTGTATLRWEVPTVNTNGSMLTNLGGYRIYYGRDASALSEMIDINHPGITSYIIERLTAGTYYFALSAYNAAGVESAMKMVGSKTIP